MDDVDRRILSLLEEDSRRTYEDIGRELHLSSSAVKRRVDRLRTSGALKGFTAIIDMEARGWALEALVHLRLRSGDFLRDQLVQTLNAHVEVIESWMVSGGSDVVAHVVARDAQNLEALTMDLKAGGLIERTHTEVVLSHLTPRRAIPPVPVD
jgi:DNA-binding Lrp family transcriptional regulator